MHWLGFLPWWLWVPYLILWLYVMATLIMEDREPADTLAWAFALLLVPGARHDLLLHRRPRLGDDHREEEVDAGLLRAAAGHAQAVLRAQRRRGPALPAGVRRHLRRAPRRHHGPRGRPRRRHRRPRRDLPHRAGEVQPPQGRPGGGAAVHPRPVLHLGERRAHRRAHRDPQGARAGRRAGALPVRLPGEQALGQDEARGAGAAGRQGRQGRRLVLPPQLPRPPQDRRHRRRDRLHRRLQRGPGVRGRRRALRASGATRTCA